MLCATTVLASADLSAIMKFLPPVSPTILGKLPVSHEPMIIAFAALFVQMQVRGDLLVEGPEDFRAAGEMQTSEMGRSDLSSDHELRLARYKLHGRWWNTRFEHHLVNQI
jgi:hypothetical protein